MMETPRFSPDNSPEARQRRMEAYSDGLTDTERRILSHRFHDPVIRECRLELVTDGLANAHDDFGDNLNNVYELPIPPRDDEPNTDAIAA